MQQYHQAVRPLNGPGDPIYDAILDKGGPMEHIGPFLLLGLGILCARWLTRRPRREAQGRR